MMGFQDCWIVVLDERAFLFFQTELNVEWEQKAAVTFRARIIITSWQVDSESWNHLCLSILIFLLPFYYTTTTEQHRSFLLSFLPGIWHVSLLAALWSTLWNLPFNACNYAFRNNSLFMCVVSIAVKKKNKLTVMLPKPADVRTNLSRRKFQFYLRIFQRYSGKNSRVLSKKQDN